MKKIFILVLLVLLISACSEEEKKEEVQPVEPTPPVIEETTISLAMVGDALIHSALYTDAKTSTGYDFTYMFDQVKPLIEDHELAFYNQETILGGTELGLSSYPRFNSPYEVGDAFVDMGFNIVALANNHSYDRGEEAIMNSLNYWDSQEGVITAGTYRSEEERTTDIIGEEQGITYALLSYTTLTNGLNTPQGKEYLVNVYNYEKVKEDVERLRDKVDVLLVSMHWGVEYTHIPNEEQTTIANELASLNVDVVIGHHPHVIQPITYINDTLVMYSLGNFISGQLQENQLVGAIASIDITKKTIDGVTDSVTIHNLGTELVYTDAICYPLADGSNWTCNTFELYPFSKLDDSILANHTIIEEKYNEIITNMYQSIDTAKLSKEAQ